MLNQDWKRRNEILGLGKDNMDFLPFSNTTLDTVKTLYRENFMNVNEIQEWNDCPGNNNFYEFMKKHPDVKCHGYIIGIDRRDYRVTIKGLSFSAEPGKIVPHDLKTDFTNSFKMADEFICKPHKIYCWYD